MKLLYVVGAPKPAPVVAFFDRVSLGVEGTRRQRPSPAVQCKPSIAIGGPGRPYARAVHGFCLRTGNPFELRYGANRLYRNLTPISLRFRSQACPLTEDEVMMATRSLFRKGYQAQPLLLELTFDIADVSFEFLRNRFISPSRYERELMDEQGRRTVYVGSPHSPLQVRIYDKMPGVVRVEVIFRSAYMRAHGIREVIDTKALSDVDLSKMIRFCERRARSPLGAEMGNAPEGWRKRMLLSWPEHRPLQMWASVLPYWRVNLMRHLADSAVQNRIAEMQRRLVW